MCADIKKPSLERLRRLAEEHGFVLAKKRHFIKRTVDVDTEAYRSFKDCARERGLKMNEALSQALEAWVASNGTNGSHKP